MEAYLLEGAFAIEGMGEVQKLLGAGKNSFLAGSEGQPDRSVRLPGATVLDKERVQIWYGALKKTQGFDMIVEASDSEVVRFGREDRSWHLCLDFRGDDVKGALAWKHAQLLPSMIHDITIARLGGGGRLFGETGDPNSFIDPSH